MSTLCRLRLAHFHLLRDSFYKYQVLYYCTLQNKLKFDKKEVELKPQYFPKDVESHQWYEWWESQGFFKPKKSENETFTLLLPPPNITGVLHLGHALTTTIQDVILRWKRMNGESVVWIPGIDHAGIATQAIVEKYLEKAKKTSKHKLGREKFVEEVWDWKEKKTSVIVQQLKDLGASVDWEKMKFTLDPVHSDIVTKSFIKLYNEGLIYRKKALINWSVCLNSSLSDIEINWVEIKKKTNFTVPGYSRPIPFGVLYKFAYKLCDEDGEIVVATTRPETMLGDTAVAIHPNNPELAKYKGKHVWHPFRQTKIPVIIDEFVDESLGTAAVKITPSHSLVDFDVGLKHNLERIEVINEKGLINKIGVIEKFHDLKRFDARIEIINELKSLGLFKGYSNHAMKVPICSRSNDVIELILKDQWFMNCKTLAEKAIRAVDTGVLKLEPEKYQKNWKDWLENVKDWNLSRQLWWGHQIPMYECVSKEKTVWVPGTSLEDAMTKACELLKTSPDNVTIARDPDVLDTWFSSGLLPLNVSSKAASTDKPPISLMVTGHDILFFWVARMVMLSLALTGQLPFHHVLLHSLVYDSKGRKMSKSWNNVIYPDDVINGVTEEELKKRFDSYVKEGAALSSDALKKTPLEDIPECGVDGLRLTLCSPEVLGEFICFDLDLCKSSRYFCNKIWQAMIYFKKITSEYTTTSSDSSILSLKEMETENLSCFDRWILSRLADTVKIAEENIPIYKFYLAVKAIRLFFVEDFCSIYLESSKRSLKNASPIEQKLIISTFCECMDTSLRLLSPFMPFLTEHLYHVMPSFKNYNHLDSITLTQYPSSQCWNKWLNQDLDKEFEECIKIVSDLRKVKIIFKMKKEKPNVYFKCKDDLSKLLYSDAEPVFSSLAGVNSIVKVEDFSQPNVIEKVFNENTVAYIEHPYDITELKNLFTPFMKKEENTILKLETMVNVIDTSVWETKTSSERNQHFRMIHSLKAELEKINQFKKTIENCNRK